MQSHNTVIHKKASSNQSVEVEIEFNVKRHNIFFRSSQDVLAPNLESFLALGLLPAMKKGTGTLIAEGPACEQLLYNLEVIQNIYTSWNPAFRHIKVEGAVPVKRQPPSSKRVGAFFSGGVDSFYTLIKNQKDITDLIFVRTLGFTIPKTSGHEKLNSSIREIAAHFGKNLIEIETNFRDFLDPIIPYPKWGWTISMALIGNLLYPYLNSIHYSRGIAHNFIYPSGELLLPLWYTGGYQLIDNGIDISRFDKVAAISNSKIALKHLHVCYRAPGEALNCGRCEKCMRTMVALEANHALERSSAFGRQLDLNFVKYYPVQDYNRVFYQESLDALNARGENPALQNALRRSIHRPEWQTSLIRQAIKFRSKVLA